MNQFHKGQHVKLVNVSYLRKVTFPGLITSLEEAEGKEVVFKGYENSYETERGLIRSCRVKGIKVLSSEGIPNDIEEYLIPADALIPVKISKPYCTIGKLKYKLLYDTNGILRFPNYNGRWSSKQDLNKMVFDYANDNRPLSDLLEYYTETGASYESTKSVFSKVGGNNHIVKQGKEQPLTFKLYL